MSAARSKWWRLTGIVTLAGALLAVGGYARHQQSLSRELRGKLQVAVKLAIDNLRSEGMPVTPDELQAWATQPPLTENAADLVIEAARHFHQRLRPGRGRGRMDWTETGEIDDRLPLVEGGKLPVRTEPLSNAVLLAAVELLATNSEALALLHRASAISTGRFPIDWSIPCGPRLSDIDAVRHGSRLLQLEAVVQIEEGRTERAVESLCASFGVARSLAQEPALIPQLMRWSCDLQTTAVLERLLTRGPISSSDRERLADDLAKAESFEGLTRSFVAQRCCLIYAFQQTKAAQFSWRDALGDFRRISWSEARSYPRQFWQMRRYRTSGLMELEFLAGLEQRSANVHVSQLPFPARISGANDLKVREELLANRQLAFMYMPAAAGAILKHARAATKFRAARAALLVEAHRETAGQLPDSLPSAPADPFTGQPLQFEKLDKGYIVYSVSQDGKDDGGDEKQDITLTVER